MKVWTGQMARKCTYQIWKRILLIGRWSQSSSLSSNSIRYVVIPTMWGVLQSDSDLHLVSNPPAQSRCSQPFCSSIVRWIGRDGKTRMMRKKERTINGIWMVRLPRLLVRWEEMLVGSGWTLERGHISIRFLRGSNHPVVYLRSDFPVFPVGFSGLEFKDIARSSLNPWGCWTQVPLENKTDTKSCSQPSKRTTFQWISGWFGSKNWLCYTRILVPHDLGHTDIPLPYQEMISRGYGSKWAHILSGESQMVASCWLTNQRKPWFLHDVAIQTCQLFAHPKCAQLSNFLMLWFVTTTVSMELL